jgi:hypothetical protein
MQHTLSLRRSNLAGTTLTQIEPDYFDIIFVRVTWYNVVSHGQPYGLVYS